MCVVFRLIAIRWHNKLRGILKGVSKASRDNCDATLGQLCMFHWRITTSMIALSIVSISVPIVNSIEIIVSSSNFVFFFSQCCVSAFLLNISIYHTKIFVHVCLRIVVDRNFWWTRTCRRRPNKNVVDSLASHRMVVQEPPKIKWEKRRREWKHDEKKQKKTLNSRSRIFVVVVIVVVVNKNRNTFRLRVNVFHNDDIWK